MSPETRKWITAAAGAIVVASAALVLMRPAWLPLTSALLAIGGIWIGLAPGLAYCVDPERRPIPFLPLTGLFYVVFFALPVFFADPDWWSGAPGKSGVEFGIVFQKLNVVAIGMLPAGVGLMFGARLVSARILRGRVPRFSLPRPRSPGRVRLLLWPLLLGHLAYLTFPSIGQTASLGQLLGPVGYLAFGMFYLLWAQGRLPRIEAMAVFLVLLPIELVQLFATGLLTKLVYFAIFMAVAIMYRHRWWLILVLVVFTGLFVAAFYPAVQEYRTQSWNGAASAAARSIP